MKTTTYICDRCKEPITNKGYSVSHDADLSPVGLDIICGIDPVYEHHYCGRQCLMLVINELVDKMDALKIEDSGAAVADPIRTLRPYTERRAVAADKKMVPVGEDRDLGTTTPPGSLEGTERSAA